MARSRSTQAWAYGGTIFAGIMMLMIGAFQIIMGIAAIARDEFFVVTENYTFDMDTTAWGWIHLILGALVLVSGCFVLTGAAWARGVGIALALLSAIDNFFFIPYYPVWSLAIIAADVFVIWALATVGSDVEPPPTSSYDTAAARDERAPQERTEGDWSHMNPPTGDRGRAMDAPADAPQAPTSTATRGRGTIDAPTSQEAPPSGRTPPTPPST